MARFSIYTGKIPEDFLGLTDKPPGVVLRMLHDFLYPQYVEECRVPMLTQDVDPGVPLRSMGAAHKGDWYPLKRGKALKAPLIIHWPTLIRNLPEFIQTNPATGLLMWLFKELFFRRSFFVGETLQRKLLRSICTFYPKVSMADYPALTEPEEVVLKHWLDKLAADKEFLYSLKSTFTWLVGKALTGKNANRCLVGYPSTQGYKGTDCSVLHLGLVPSHKDTFPLKMVLQDIDSETYTRMDMQSLLYELLYASRLPIKMKDYSNRYIPEQFGVLVASRKHKGKVKNILAINFSRFYPHRETYSTNRYSSAYPKYEKHFTAPKDVVMFLASYVEDNYHTLRLPWSTYEFKDAFFGNGKFWENKDEWATTVFVDADALRTLGIRDRRRVETVRTQKKRKRKKTRGGWRVRVYEEAYVIPNTFDSYTFRMLFHRGNILFTSPWAIPDSERKVPQRQYKGLCGFKCAEGTKYFESLDEWYYTLTFLKFSPSFLGSSVKGLLDWLDGFEKLNRRQFYGLMEKKKPRVGSKLAFTEEEDKAIIALYRPSLALDDEVELFTVCANRSMQSISNRARVLRNEMITDGEYNINKLPHKHYNSRLLRQLKEEKAKAKWVRENKPS